MDEAQFKLLRELSRDGSRSQRELSRIMGLSLGKVNYVINELLKKGLIKMNVFRNSKNKLGYRYILTPKGASEKFRQTHRFIVRKQEEYERLKAEIDLLTHEANGTPVRDIWASSEAYEMKGASPDSGQR